MAELSSALQGHFVSHGPSRAGSHVALGRKLGLRRMLVQAMCPPGSLCESWSISSRITSGPGEEVGLKEDVGSGSDTVSILTESNLPLDGISRTKLIKDNVYVPLHEKWKDIV